MSAEKMKEAIGLSTQGKREEAKAAVSAILDSKKNDILGQAKDFIKANLFKQAS